MKNEEYRRMDLAPHNVILENREHLSVSGVSEVISFDENQVSLVTSMGILTVGGQQLHVEKLNLEVGEIAIAGQIEGWLESYKGDFVCSKQLYREALGKSFADPSRWDLHNIREVMREQKNWTSFTGTKYFRFYGKQRGWMRNGDKTQGNKAQAE